MKFIHPELQKVYVENKGKAEKKLKKLNEINEDIETLHQVLRKLAISSFKMTCETKETFHWDGKNLSISTKGRTAQLLAESDPETKISLVDKLPEFLKKALE